MQQPTPAFLSNLFPLVARETSVCRCLQRAPGFMTSSQLIFSLTVSLYTRKTLYTHSRTPETDYTTPAPIFTPVRQLFAILTRPRQKIFPRQFADAEKVSKQQQCNNEQLLQSLCTAPCAHHPVSLCCQVEGDISISDLRHFSWNFKKSFSHALNLLCYTESERQAQKM